MIDSVTLPSFDDSQIECLSTAVSTAEELVSGYYKMSGTEWGAIKYDFKTLRDLLPSEIVTGPLAQILRYRATPNHSTLELDSYDFYKICIQDHCILKIVRGMPQLNFFAFLLYIASHELVHVVRFFKFFKGFEVPVSQKMTEEIKVHETTIEILSKVNTDGMSDILRFYDLWQYKI